MRVIEDNYKKMFPMEVKCKYCKSVIELDKKDVDVFRDEVRYECPVCKRENTFPQFDGITDTPITADTIRFPNDFYHFGNGVNVTEKEIENEIRKLIERFRNNIDESPYYYAAFGNTFIQVFNYPDDKEYYVVVSKNYYDIHIPYEQKDYKR